MTGFSAFGAATTAEAGSRSRYLQDLNRLIAPKLVPDAPLLADDLAAPYAGRRADEVGEWYLLHRRAGVCVFARLQDLLKVATRRHIVLLQWFVRSVGIRQVHSSLPVRTG